MMNPVKFIKCTAIATAFIALMATTSCTKKIIPNGITVKETIDLDYFESIEVSDGLDITMIESDKNEMEIRTSTNVMPYILYYTDKDGRLYIGMKNVHFSSNPKIEIKVRYAAPVTAVEASGGSCINAESAISGLENFKIILSGGSRFEFVYGNLNCTTLEVDLSGGAQTNILGTCSNYIIKASGGSQAKGFNMNCDNLDADISGGSVLNVTCHNRFNLIASGGSRVEIKGNCTPDNMEISGGSDVKFGNR